MIFKVTYVPNEEMTARSLLSKAGPGPLSDEELRLAMADAMQGVYNTEYNVFVYADTLLEAMRKLNTWYDDEDCLITHDKYSQIVFNVLIEVVDPTDNQPVLLNALATVL